MLSARSMQSVFETPQMATENGQNGHARAESTVLERVSPIDGNPLPPLSMATAADVARAMEAARTVAPEWAARRFSARFEAILRAAKAMLQNRHEALTLVKEEMGKHEVEAIFTEALGPLDAVNGWKKIIEPLLDRKVGLNPMAFAGKRAHTQLVPRGVIGVIAPWNYPITGLYRALFPALLTGNAVIVKPSEYTPRATGWFVKELAKHLPHGVVQLLPGDGSVGKMLLESGIDACVFTGSPETGAKVRVRCAELGIPASIEMGGNDAAIVLADAELERTTAGLTQWALSNSGQACGAIEIAYVDERIADELVDRLRLAWQRLRTGPGADDIEIHPIANAKQLAVVEAHVADAIAKGAKLVTGGRRTGAGLGYLPTLLDRCTDQMDVVQNETFGPVLAIVRFKGVEEAVRAINTGRYGLGASVWTRDLERGTRIAERLDVGVASVNNHAFTGAIAALPWSGTRATGSGVANSEWSLLTFCRPKTLVVDSSEGPELYWMPFDKEMGELGHLLADAQIGKIWGAWKIPLLIRRRITKIKAYFR